MTVEGQFKLVAEFEEEEVFELRVSVEVLPAGTGDVSISLDD